MHHSGTYFLIFATDTENTLVEANETNNVASVPVLLNIVEQPSIGVPGAQTNGELQLPVYGTIGMSYSLEVSTNLVNWEIVSPFYCTNNPTYVTAPNSSNSRVRFYRIAWQ